jgi:hypothetical protein
MATLAMDRKTTPTPDASPSPRTLARQRAVLSVILGAPPAAVAADLGCDVITLMGWVRAQRLQLQRTARTTVREADQSAEGGRAEDAPAPAPVRHIARRMLPNDKPVAPENPALVEAAYQAAEFDYSGRRVRPAVTHASH